MWVGFIDFWAYKDKGNWTRFFRHRSVKEVFFFYSPGSGMKWFLFLFFIYFCTFSGILFERWGIKDINVWSLYFSSNKSYILPLTCYMVFCEEAGWSDDRWSYSLFSFRAFIGSWYTRRLARLFRLWWSLFEFWGHHSSYDFLVSSPTLDIVK